MFTWLRIVIILTFQLFVQYRGAHDSIVHSPSIFNQNIQNSFFLQKVTIYIYMYNYALIANIREKEKENGEVSVQKSKMFPYFVYYRTQRI